MSRAALAEAEAALARERERRQRAERELAVVEGALLRLLRLLGSEVADADDVRLGLGLPAISEAAGDGRAHVAEAESNGARVPTPGLLPPGAGGRFSCRTTSVPSSLAAGRTERARGWC